MATHTLPSGDVVEDWDGEKVAGAYLRLSGQGQEQGDGFRRQWEDFISRQAQADGYRIPLECMALEIWTGREDDRPKLIALLGELAERGITRLYVESMDRFARGLSVQMKLLDLLVDEGFTLISAATGTDITADWAGDPMSRALVQMQGVFFELEKKLLVRKLRLARNAAKEKTQGKSGKEGPKAYGSRPEEHNGLELIKQFSHEGPKAVAERLNRAGILTRRGRTWNRSSVWGILQRLDTAASAG